MSVEAVGPAKRLRIGRARDENGLSGVIDDAHAVDRLQAPVRQPVRSFDAMGRRSGGAPARPCLRGPGEANPQQFAAADLARTLDHHRV